MSENRIIGFTNPSHFFPMYLVVLFVNNSQVFARYPSGDDCRIKNTEEDCLNRPSIIRAKDKAVLSDKDIAFAISEEEIYVEPVEKILERMQSMLDSGRFKDDADATEILEKLLEAK
jgi:hypothetical protein